jgi:hypothetical protein
MWVMSKSREQLQAICGNHSADHLLNETINERAGEPNPYDLKRAKIRSID